MKFSNEEQLMIKKNIEDISDWINLNQKNIRSEIKIPIHHYDYSLVFFVRENEYFLTIGKSTNYFPNKKLSPNSLSNYLSDDHVFAFYFIQNWQMIKLKVLEEIRSQMNVLCNFEV